ncbi:MAG: Hsp20/alpha crystallin family protein [Candidatus Wildermuthbacteria bacterium]|nr:Hsp20/alpha crystallin family protein [Candidatus Wildermuthbacteria bacterium]
MASFFEKLRNSMGIEEDGDARETSKNEPAEPRAQQKTMDGKTKKITVKASVAKTEEKPLPKKEGGNAEWFEPEGELAVDVYQTDKDIVIQSTVAGVKPEDLDITIENDAVTIAGERKNVAEEQGKNYYYQECYWGAFSRQIILPEEVDASRAEASMKEGIFTLRIPKIERQRTRKIKVKI